MKKLLAILSFLVIINYHFAYSSEIVETEIVLPNPSEESNEQNKELTYLTKFAEWEKLPLEIKSQIILKNIKDYLEEFKVDKNFELLEQKIGDLRVSNSEINDLVDSIFTDNLVNQLVKDINETSEGDPIYNKALARSLLSADRYKEYVQNIPQEVKIRSHELEDKIIEKMFDLKLNNGNRISTIVDIKELIKNGADIDRLINKNNINENLKQAIFSNLFGDLVLIGRSINPLILAVAFTEPEIVDVLIRAGADVNVLGFEDEVGENFTPLMLAQNMLAQINLFGGSPEEINNIIYALRSANWQNPNIKNNYGNTVVMIACATGQC